MAMKILFVTRGLHSQGGIERVTSVIASELAKRGYQTGIVCLQQGKPFFPLRSEVKLHYLKKGRALRISRLRQLYRVEKPDVVVFLGSHRLFMNAPAAKGLHSITWEHFNSKINWHPLHKLSRKIAVRTSQRIVTLTQRDADNYKRLFGATNAVCIPNPITINDIEPSPLTEKRVLAVGRLAGQKGFDMMLDAWAKTSERRNGWQLRIVGSGSHLRRLERQISELGIGDSVEIIPATKNIEAQYRQASVMAMSSRYEGFSLVLVEAMAAGLPIASFDCDMGPAEIIEDGKTGILVPPADTDKLAEALDKLMSDEAMRKAFAQESLVSVKRFAVDNIVARWEKLLAEVNAR